MRFYLLYSVYLHTIQITLLLVMIFTKRVSSSLRGPVFGVKALHCSIRTLSYLWNMVVLVSCFGPVLLHPGQDDLPSLYVCIWACRFSSIWVWIYTAKSIQWGQIAAPWLTEPQALSVWGVPFSADQQDQALRLSTEGCAEWKCCATVFWPW